MLSKLQENQRVALKLTSPAGRTLMWATAFTLLIALFLEILARTTWVQQIVPFQAYGTNHIQFEMQLRNLKSFAAKNGDPDCLILGTSQSLRSLDPQAIDQTYQAQTGHDLLCYNFSIVGANLVTTASFAQILFQQYHPRLIILGTSFLDYTQAREKRFDPRFQQNAWLDYRLGAFTSEGWLVEHSYAYRLLMMLSYSAPSGLDFKSTIREVRKWSRELTNTGYGYSEEIFSLAEDISPGEVKNFLEEFDDFSLSTQNLNSLEQLAELAKAHQAQLIVLEMPYHESLFNLPGLDENARRQAQQQLTQFTSQLGAQIKAITSRQGVLYWTLEQAPAFTKTSWLDRYHLNKNGSAIFSQWLAERIAEAVAAGQIANPSREP